MILVPQNVLTSDGLLEFTLRQRILLRWGLLLSSSPAGLGAGDGPTFPPPIGFHKSEWLFPQLAPVFCLTCLPQLEGWTVAYRSQLVCSCPTSRIDRFGILASSLDFATSFFFPTSKLAFLLCRDEVSRIQRIPLPSLLPPEQFLFSFPDRHSAGHCCCTFRGPCAFPFFRVLRTDSLFRSRGRLWV